MKKLIFILGLGLTIGMANFNKAESQVHVSINIDVQPSWGPSGYNYAEFYYLPEINVYYDVVNRLYYFPNGRRWVSGVYLPMAYSYYDFYSLYKVVINGVHTPWRHNKKHVRLYSGYCYNYAQVPIFYVMDTRYHRARVNYHGWVEPRYMPKNDGRPRSNNFSANTRNGKISGAPSYDNRREAVSTRSTQRETAVNSGSRSSNMSNSRPEVGSRSSRGTDSTVSRSSVSNSSRSTSGRSSERTGSGRSSRR